MVLLINSCDRFEVNAVSAVNSIHLDSADSLTQLAQLARVAKFVLFQLTVLFSIVAQSSTDRILFLSSGSTVNCTWAGKQLAGVQKAFADANVDFRVHVEDLNLVEFASSVHYEDTRRHLVREYLPLKKEIKGIFVDTDTLRFYLKYLAQDFKDVPVVVTGLEPTFKLILEHPELKLIGVTPHLGTLETLDLIRKLQPKTERVLVLADNSESGNEYFEEVLRIAPRYPFKFLRIGHKTLSETAQTLKDAMPTDVVLKLRFVRDGADQTLTSVKSEEVLQKHARVPVYGVREAGVGKGVLGGKVISGFRNGKLAAELFLRYLSDPTQYRNGLVTRSPSRYMFDYEQLERFGIDVSLLPEDSDVINRPFSVYQTYKFLTWSIAFALAVLISLVVALIGVNSRLRKTRSILQIEVAEHKTEIERRAKAERANRAKTEFVASLSHELRTPLTSIMGFAESLATKDLDHEKQLQYIEGTHRNAKTLLRLIEDILDIARIESGKISFELRKFNPRSIIDDVIQNAMPVAINNRTQISFKNAELIRNSFVTDPARMTQILSNLIGNAVKFSPGGSVEVETFQKLQQKIGDRRRLEIKIRDTGLGLSPEQVARIFRPFGQADQSTRKKYGGTGLGLYISRRLARTLGGDVLLESTHQGGGSVFVLSLPDLHDQSHGDPSQREVSPEDNSVLLGSRVLIVEDDSDVRSLFTDHFSYLGAKVDAVISGEDAVACATHTPYDLVLLDLKRSGIHGDSVARRLRSAGFRNAIIAVTGHANPEDRTRSFDAGIDALFTKPTRFRELDATIRRMMKQQRNLRVHACASSRVATVATEAI